MGCVALSVPALCRDCGERISEEAPCRCDRRRLQAGALARGDRATDACADGQHYACCGYVRYGRRWRRCVCACHPEVAAA